jgi:single-stranded DNA-binding protein
MIAFHITGNVGRVTKKIYDGKSVTYLSVASVSFYNKKSHTTWVNNIAFYGALADVVSNIVTSGLKIYISGTINTAIKNKSQVVYFTAEKFELMSFSEERQNERLQKQAVDNLPDDEEMYPSHGGDDLPY